ncbi:MAG: hypothetical protein ACRENP_03700 [Longimicrobiales bacterium]
MRFLHSTVRLVQVDTAAYRAAWADLRERATQAGVRAWMFRHHHDETRYIEFLEWQQSELGNSPMLDPELRKHCDGLSTFGPGRTDEWVEA